jgi:hypothetical protein
MTRILLIPSLGWRSVGVAAVLLVTLPAGSPAARHRVREAPLTGPTVNASDSAGFGSRAWLRPLRLGNEPALDLQLDDFMEELDGGGALRLDREALTRLAQSVVGEEIAVETLTAGQVLDRVGRVRVSAQGLSVVLGRRTLVRILQNLLGSDARVDRIPMSEVLDSLTGAEVTADGVRGRMDQPALLAALGGVLDRVQRPDHSADPAFDRRRALQAQYGRVVSLVRQLRREGFAGVPRDQVYDEAYNRLLAAKESGSVPLLDGHLQLEEALAGARVAGLDRSERIRSRFEARRAAFGDENAELLFGRQEALERYEIDRLALSADGELSDGDKASRLEERRQALKVELAAQGSYVSFPRSVPAASAAPDESLDLAEPAALEAPAPSGLAVPDAGRGRGGRRQ